MADILFKKESGPHNTFFPSKVRTMLLWPVPYGMVIVSSFKLSHNESSGFFTITSEDVICCPLCSGGLFYRDSRLRMLKDLFGTVSLFFVRRLRCAECKKLHTELTSIIQPYKHYSSDAIQSVLSGGEAGSDCVADNSTIRRWKIDFAQAEPDVNQRLASVYAQITEAMVPIARTVHILDKIRIKINAIPMGALYLSEKRKEILRGQRCFKRRKL
jgi:hypothetical protein